MDDKPTILKNLHIAEEWEQVLSAAAHLQRIVPGAVLVGGSASSIHAGHRFSRDDDHVVENLAERFEKVLEDLEEVAGWNTVRISPHKLILGNLDGVETGVRNLIRSEPLETEILETKGRSITIPTLNEMCRIKAYLATTRNATRDYLDFVALAERIEIEFKDECDAPLWRALESMDRLYPQPNGESITLQLAKQLSSPLPHDLGDGNLGTYRLISKKWRTWDAVKTAAQACAVTILENYRTNKRDR